MKDPVLCCQLAGVQPPASALQHSNTNPPVSSDEVTLEYQGGGGYGSPSIKNNKQETETIVSSVGCCLVSLAILFQNLASSIDFRFSWFNMRSRK